ERFAHGQAIPHHQHLVDQLHDLTRANVANVGDGLAHGLEGWECSLEIFFTATHHDGECPFGCTFTATADWRVNQMDAFGWQLGGDLTRGLWADGAAIDDEGARLGCLNDALLAKDDGFYIGRVADTSNNNVAVSGDICWATACFGTIGDQGINFAGCTIPNPDREAIFQQIAGHTLTHN